MADLGSARSVSWADYDDDGDFDLYISKYNEANSLYRHDATTFSDVAPALGLADAGRGESACWADFDLDGDIDLFLANYLGESRLWRNENHGASFTEIGALVGLNCNGPAVGTAWADLDNDGDPDLCLGGYDGTTRLYRNDFATGNHWLKVHVHGTTANAAGIGARVRCVTGPQVQVRDVGGGNGYLSQNELTLIFGLGSRTLVDTLLVRWPGGGLDRFVNLAVDQTHTLVQGSGQTDVNDTSPVPSTLRLVGNWPNPFNPGTRIAFELPAEGEIELGIYDPRGRRVTVLIDEAWPAGRYEVEWNGRDGSGRNVSAGVYFTRLRGAGRTVTRPLVVVR